MSAPRPGDLRRRVLRSGRWTLLRTICLGVLQFATIAALFRLLEIEDFAAIAIVTVVLTLTQVFSQTGVDLALVREEGEIEPLLAPCWSVSVVRGFVLGGIVAALALPIAWWQEEPALGDYLLVSALVPILDGMRSISTILFLKEIDQRRPAIIDTLCAAVSLATLVALAAWLRSPWAIVVNQIWAVGLRSAAYHLAHPVRTRFTLRWGPLRPHFRFGIGYNLAASSTYLIESVDRLLIGRMLGMHSLGIYDRSITLSHYGVRQIPSLFSATLLYPALSKIRSDTIRFWRLVRRIVGGLSFAGVVVAGALWWAAEPILAVVIGEEHALYLAPFRLLLALALFRGIAILAQIPFYVLGRPRFQTMANLVQVVILVVGLPWVFGAGGTLIDGCTVALVAGAANLLVTLGIVVALARQRHEVAAPEIDQPAPGESPAAVTPRYERTGSRP